VTAGEPAVGASYRELFARPVLRRLAAAPAGLLVGAATAAGLVNPPLSPGMRSLWAAYTGARLKQAAFALDAAVFDLAYITGPALAGGR
jgi:hypothetical protein